MPDDIVERGGMTFAPHEVVAEFSGRTTRPKQEQLDALARREISAWALAGEPGTGERGIGFTRASPRNARRFDFADDGEPAIAVIALNDFAEPVDICAWPLRGAWVASWCGVASMLGAQHVMAPRIVDTALPIFPDPFAWLQGERQGVVIIDGPRAARDLQGWGPFLATGGIEHGERLEAVLAPPKPLILVPVAEQDRRAA